MEKEQSNGTVIHQSSKTKGKANIRINSDFPHKRVALLIPGNGTIIINKSPDENIKMKLKVRRRTKIRRS